MNQGGIHGGPLLHWTARVTYTPSNTFRRDRYFRCRYISWREDCRFVSMHRRGSRVVTGGAQS